MGATDSTQGVAAGSAGPSQTAPAAPQPLPAGVPPADVVKALSGALGAATASKKPGVTQAQVVAALTAGVSEVVAFGFMGHGTGQLAVAVGGVVIGAAWQIADAIHQHGHSTGVGAELAKKL